MSGGKERNERYLREKRFRPIAMQTLAAGALRPAEAFSYLSQFPRIESVLFGSGSKQHIAENIEGIRESFASSEAPLSLAD
jgi:predicted aldo/keto reductase-like oxidoreductase